MGQAVPAGATPPPWWMSLPLASDVNYELTGPASNLNVFLQTLGLENAPTMAPAPSPSSQVPAAPQTQPAMVTWDPAALAEATAQRQAQFNLDTTYLQSLQNPDTGTPDSGSSGGSGWLWAGLAIVGGVLVFSLVK